jgi:hypothetical protein
MTLGAMCMGVKRYDAYGPLVKSLTQALPQDTQQDESAAKREDS